MRTPTYKELEQKIKELENAVHGHSGIEEELSKSEELHRIILTNLSDTVLITDESGTFTFVCPNVNVIFGYSRDDVFALGNVKKLLGGQLVDHDRLETLNEIQNIEKEIGDKSGKMHPNNSQCSPPPLSRKVVQELILISPIALWR